MSKDTIGTRAILPGSFDPFTRGHLDLALRAARIVDQVTILVVYNPNKTGFLPVAERADLIRRVLADDATLATYPDLAARLTVDTWSGLLVDYTSKNGASVIIKGLRSGQDFDYEEPMAHMNHHLTGVDTMFLPTAPGNSFISSSLVREVARLGGDVSELVPPVIASTLQRVFHS